MVEAIIVLDIVKDTYERTSKHYQGDEVRAIVPRVQGLLSWARSTGRPVIFVQSARRPTDRFWFSHFQPRGVKPDHIMWGNVRPIDDLYKDGEPLVYKRRLSGFYQSDLEVTLKEMGVDRVILVGSSTHVCIMLTAIEAFQRGIEVVVPEDCTTVPLKYGGEENKKWALSYMERWACAKITTSEELKKAP
jgi:nicotinamidase-related amidase